MSYYLDTGQYWLYTLSGLVAISSAAWLMHRWSQRRRPSDGGAAAGYLIKVVEGYELAPVSGQREPAQRFSMSGPKWRSMLSDDPEAVRDLVSAPALSMDRYVVRSPSLAVQLSAAEVSILLLAARASARDVRRTRKELRSRTVPSERGSAATAAFAGTDVSLQLAHREMPLNGAGREFVVELLNASRIALEDAGHYLGIGAVGLADWMPGNEFSERGGVLREY